MVGAGLVVAWAIAWLAVEIRQRATQGPEAQASSGMYAFGDLVLGVGVFGVLALIPIAAALYWLRPVPRFWSVLVWGAVLFSASGFLAVAANLAAPASKNSWMILTHVRIGIMPLSALAFFTCAIFAPVPGHRWRLIAAAFTDAAIFVGIFLRLLLHNSM